MKLFVLLLVRPRTPGSMMRQSQRGDPSLNRGCGGSSLHRGCGGSVKIRKLSREKSFMILSSMDENRGKSFKSFSKKSEIEEKVVARMKHFSKFEVGETTFKKIENDKCLKLKKYICFFVHIGQRLRSRGKCKIKVSNRFRNN